MSDAALRGELSKLAKKNGGRLPTLVEIKTALGNEVALEIKSRGGLQSQIVNDVDLLKEQASELSGRFGD